MYRSEPSGISWSRRCAGATVAWKNPQVATAKTVSSARIRADRRWRFMQLLLSLPRLEAWRGWARRVPAFADERHDPVPVQCEPAVAVPDSLPGDAAQP